MSVKFFSKARTFIARGLRLWSIALLLVVLQSGCIGPRAVGDAGAELVYLVPGDRILLDTGEEGYVDGDGFLRGIRNTDILAAGRQAREVVNEIAVVSDFDRYQVIHSGKRQVEVRGAIKNPGIYPFPKEEDWTLMDLLFNVEGFVPSENREYLLIRRSWLFPGTFLFIKGESFPTLGGIGGDDLMVFSGDLVIFPGDMSLIYVFGAVQDQAECFGFPTEAQLPTLQIAIEKAGGVSKNADIRNILVYRILRQEKQSVYTLDMERAGDFVLEPWDVVYVSPRIPRELVR